MQLSLRALELQRSKHLKYFCCDRIMSKYTAPRIPMTEDTLMPMMIVSISLVVIVEFILSLLQFHLTSIDLKVKMDQISIINAFDEWVYQELPNTAPKELQDAISKALLIETSIKWKTNSVQSTNIKVWIRIRSAPVKPMMINNWWCKYEVNELTDNCQKNFQWSPTAVIRNYSSRLPQPPNLQELSYASLELSSLFCIFYTTKCKMVEWQSTNPKESLPRR